MIRSYLRSTSHTDAHFKPRGVDTSRLESLSDGVFALAIAQLILSATSPTNYNALVDSLKLILPFGITITLIFRLWLQHVRFFYYYNLSDQFVYKANIVLLFLILIYVYPLKFLFTVFFQIMYTLIFEAGNNYQWIVSNVLSGTDGSGLMVFFGIGGASIYGIYVLLYRHALKLMSTLSLTEVEAHITKTDLLYNVYRSVVSLVSAAIAYFHIGGTWSFPLAGACYLILIVILALVKKKRSKGLEKIEALTITEESN